MKNVGPAIKVAITFIGAVVLGYWAFMMLVKGGCNRDEETLRLHAYLKDASGLVEKSRVQTSGLTIGNIVARELNVKPPRQELVRQKRFAKVTILVDDNVTLYSNATVFKKSASLLGEFYLEIDPGTYEWVDADGKRHVGEVLKDGDEIENVVEAITTDAIMRQVSDVVPLLKNIAEDIRSFTMGPLQEISKSVKEGIDENRGAVRSMLNNLDAITSDVRRITRDSNDEILAIIEDIKAITGGIRGVVGTSDKEVKETAEKLKNGLDKLASAIDKLDNALGDVEEITEGVKEGEGTVGRLLTDDELIDNIEGVVQDAGGFVRSLTGLQTIVGLRSEYNFQANSIKTYVSVEIRPRPDKYYLIELIDDPRGSRTVTQRTTRSDDPSKPLLVREEEVVVTDAFRFTFQFAKEISITTLRFGIKESTGGVGFDLRLFDERLRVESDLFDFQANVWPRFKVMGAYEFFRRLYVVGGVDDVFNDRPLDGSGGGRDYFLGAQLRFNDEDLKSLMLFGGGAMGGVSK